MNWFQVDNAKEVHLNDWVELNLNTVLDVQLDEKCGKPAFGAIVACKAEVEITLTVNDMSAFKLLIATDAMAVLTKNNVCAAKYHFVAKVIESRRRVTAIFLTAVVDADEIITVFLGFSDVLHG